MQKIDTIKDQSNILNASQFSQLAKHVFMNCPHHKYEQICYINISQNIGHIGGSDGYDSCDPKDDDYSQSSEDNEDIKGIQAKDDEDLSVGGSNVSSWNRFLCAECILVIDIDKNNLLPLRKLVFNQNKLYNNWPPLESGLNRKIYDILKIDKDQHECMMEIDKTCSNLIEQFSNLVNQLKKDLMRIEGERFQILADLQKLYEDVSSIDSFSGLLSQSTTPQPVQPQSTQQQQQQQFQGKDSLSFDFDSQSTNNSEIQIELNYQLQQQQQLLASVIKPLSQNASSYKNQSEEQSSSSLKDDSSQQRKPNGKPFQDIRRKIEEFLDDKYSEKRGNSQKLNKIMQQLNKFKPLEENLLNLKDYGFKMQNKLNQFSNQIKFKLNLTDFSMQKSLFKNSSLLNIDRNHKNQITIQTEGSIWGQVYSDFILDNHSTYQFVFQFRQEVQNFVIIGLIPDAYKDQISQGSSQNHFGKIFGQENVTYCGSNVKGSSQLSFLKKNDMIQMEVCVSKNHLTFSDYPHQYNITKLHSDYNLTTNGKYRLCIEYYDFEDENTITIVDAKCF